MPSSSSLASTACARPCWNTAARRAPARPAEEVGDRRPQQADDRAVVQSLSFRRGQQVAAKAAAATFWSNDQPVQSGNGNLHRTELHDAVGQVDVGNDAARAPQEQPVARFVEGVFHRRLEFGLEKLGKMGARNWKIGS